MQHLSATVALTFRLLGAIVVLGAAVQLLACSARADDSRAPKLVADFVHDYCLDCHAGDSATSGLNLETAINHSVTGNLDVWENVVLKLHTGQMPPTDAYDPEPDELHDVLQQIVGILDRHAEQNPMPGRTDTLRHLTRFEYQNCIRDLLHLDVPVDELLPPDEISHGFDNVTLGTLSPARLDRYISAAQKISRLAVGRTTTPRISEVIRVRPDVTQEWHVEGLPLGTRGGVIAPVYFPLDGEYEVSVRLARDRDEHVEGLTEPHQLDVLLDDSVVQSFTVSPPIAKRDSSDEYDLASHEGVDRHLCLRIPVAAGQHRVGVTFVQKSMPLLETNRQPLNVHFNVYRHPRLTPAVYQVTVTGPVANVTVGDTASRRQIFTCRPTSPDDELRCAKQIVSTLMRRACRGQASEQDIEEPLRLYREARQEHDFEAGIEAAVSGVLMQPKFLFRIERDPVGIPSGTAYEINDLELASRLSFFLWSSQPDDRLLNLAQRGQLSDPTVLEQQARRLMADRRANALVKNFAGQWLHLRNLASTNPDARRYADFDDNLRQSMARETELLFEQVVRDDRSIKELLKTDQTYLNERLAKHYDIPHVYGSRFRRVPLDEASHRGGLLRHGSVLTVTSYATRTSPVLRGKWILENIIGTPPPPPPPDVPELSENTVDKHATLRERLEQHRADASCATCHQLIDPVGFALENYDAVGRWRILDDGEPVDATGGLPDGSECAGVVALEDGLLRRPDIFASALTEKLLVYALGRGLEVYDAPAVREIVRNAQPSEYQFSSLIVGIVQSTSFRMRTAQ